MAGGVYGIKSLDSPATCSIGDYGTELASDDHILRDYTGFKYTGRTAQRVAAPAQKKRVTAKPVKGEGVNQVTILLKNGNTFEAAVLQETESSYTFKINGGTFTINKDDIADIKR